MCRTPPTALLHSLHTVTSLLFVTGGERRRRPRKNTAESAVGELRHLATFCAPPAASRHSQKSLSKFHIKTTGQEV